MLSILERELRALFSTPGLWLLLAFSAGLMGVVFVFQLQIFLEPPGGAGGLPDQFGLIHVVLVPVASWGALTLMLIAPLLAMKAFAEERKSKTLVLLLSAPLSLPSIVMAKFLVIVFVLLTFMAVFMALPLILFLGSEPDFGHIASIALGLTSTCCIFAASGLYCSVLTEQPAVAAGLCMVALLASWLLGLSPPAHDSTVGMQLLAALSWQTHLSPSLAGIIDSLAVAFSLCTTALFLALTMIRLDAERSSG